MKFYVLVDEFKTRCFFNNLSVRLLLISSLLFGWLNLLLLVNFCVLRAAFAFGFPVAVSVFYLVVLVQYVDVLSSQFFSLCFDLISVQKFFWFSVTFNFLEFNCVHLSFFAINFIYCCFSPKKFIFQ